MRAAGFEDATIAGHGRRICMNRFDTMIEGLREEMEVPEKVWEKYMDTLENLPVRRPAGARRCLKYASLAAAMTAAVFFCAANPVVAARIPVIGKIFEKIEQFLLFSGEYSEKAEPLAKETGDKGTEAFFIYSAEDAGVKFTASEIYCDGLSVYVTAEVELEQGGLEEISGDSMYLGGNWKLAGGETEKPLENNNLEGKAIDDRTFIGMIKFDPEEMEAQEGTLELELSMIGFDDLTDLALEDISASHKIEGNWSLRLPFHVDSEAEKTIRIGKEENGYRIDQVVVSPYQVITYTDVPYVKNAMTPEEFENMMREKTGGSDEFGLTYEEYMERQGKVYQTCCTIVFNQDDEMLRRVEEYQGRCVSAVQGKEISRLYIYLVDDKDALDKLDKGCERSEVAKVAAASAEVEVKKAD